MTSFKSLSDFLGGILFNFHVEGERVEAMIRHLFAIDGKIAYKNEFTHKYLARTTEMDL